MSKDFREVKGPFLFRLPLKGGRQEVFIDGFVFGGSPEVIEQFTDEQLKQIGFDQLSKLTTDHLTTVSAQACLESGDLPLKPGLFWLKTKTRLKPNHISLQREIEPEPQHLLPKSQDLLKEI